MAEADSRCSPDERSDFIAGALHRSTRGQQKSAAGRCHGVGPAKADHHAVASFPRRTSFIR
jgi:hypothetical protein